MFSVSYRFDAVLKTGINLQLLNFLLFAGFHFSQMTQSQLEFFKMLDKKIDEVRINQNMAIVYMTVQVKWLSSFC